MERERGEQGFWDGEENKSSEKSQEKAGACRVVETKMRIFRRCTIQQCQMLPKG